MIGSAVTTLPSGLRVATRTMPYVNSLSVGIWVMAGARDETETETGIAHMLEHMAFSTRPRTTSASSTSRSSGSTAPSPSRASTSSCSPSARPVAW